MKVNLIKQISDDNQVIRFFKDYIVEYLNGEMYIYDFKDFDNGFYDKKETNSISKAEKHNDVLTVNFFEYVKDLEDTEVLEITEEIPEFLKNDIEKEGKKVQLNWINDSEITEEKTQIEQIQESIVELYELVLGGGEI